MKFTNCVLMMLGLFTATMFISGCGNSGTTPKENKKAVKKGDHESEHGHGAGPHGGAVADWGGGKYHVEFLVDHNKQEATVYVLGSDEKTSTPIKTKDGQLLLTIKQPSFQVTLTAAPLTGETADKSSVFVGKHENLGKVQEFGGTISGEVDGTPYAGDFQETAEIHEPLHSSNEAEKQLYLTAGGIYTEQDIKANGNVIASEKFKGFMAVHDLKPKVGDKICPITLTKANPKISWVIAGKTYEFCCPPCVDEFVKLAKENPKEIKAPDEYVKK